MSFFSDHYQAIRYPEDSEATPGLRRPQSGAIHAIASYFTRHSQLEKTKSAIVVMPTGSGKTAVLLLAPFVLKAQRILVITPSDLVRSQITNQFTDFNILKNIGALVGDIGQHKVCMVNSRLTTKESWVELKEFDVVISTPNCVSPGYNGIANAPEDLFDLLLVDEAHHVPAKTWTAILKAFPQAKNILFTATPFRHDEQAIEGEMIYEFSIREAFEDRIFGELQFIPVELIDTISADIAIAKKTEEVFREDRRNKLDHYILVRTDKMDHARELEEIYKQHTKLHLQTVHSGLAEKAVDATIDLLLQKKLDGIICIEMLGEGFDFPNLKIAAIHKPHKSFPVTLQFIGRFARTNAEKIGKAKFIALPQDIRIDMEQLYKEGKVWQEIIPDLYQNRILAGAETREKLATFTPLNEEFLSDLSLDDFKPLQHVKIYRLFDGANLETQFHLKEAKVVKRFKSDKLSTILFISESMEIPDWSSTDVFKRIDYDLFVIYYHAETNLLFINSSKRNETLYDEIVQQMAVQNNGKPRYERLPIWETNRVLRELDEPCFFNIGMVNRIAASHSESYRIIAGPRAQEALLRSDGNIYHRGHIYGRGREKNQWVMLGYSSSARVWSNKTASIPDLIEWCRCLAESIASKSPVTTNSALDVIPIPERIRSLPKNIWTAIWNEELYLSFREAKYELGIPATPETSETTDVRKTRPPEHQFSLLDFDLKVVMRDEDRIRFSIQNDEIEWQADYSPAYPYFTFVSTTRNNFKVRCGSRWIDMIDYLKEHPIGFLTERQDQIQGSGILKYGMKFQPFDRRKIKTIKWKKEKVDIAYEYGPPVPIKNSRCKENLISIHDFLTKYLIASEAEVVFYDHASGEIADFITFKLSNNSLDIALYHVKGAKTKGNPKSKSKSEPKAGARVGDVYEVTGQAVKSMAWLSKERLQKQIKYRHAKKHPFKKGDMKTLDNLFAMADENNLPYKSEIYIVQPGLSRSKIAERRDILNILASADDYLTRCHCVKFGIMGSS